MPEQIPDKIPNVTRAVSIRVDDPVLRTKFETGRARQRNRFEKKPKSYSVSWELTDEQYSIFEYFHRVRLNNGADYFIMDLPATQGLQTVTARFVKGDYSVKHKGVLHWVVSAVVEIEEDYGMTAEVFELYTTGAFGDIGKFGVAANDLDMLVNTTLPNNYGE